MVAGKAEMLRQDLRHFMEQHNTSSRAMAGMLGVTPPVISQWLSSKYKGNNRRIEQAVQAFLRRAREREQQMRHRAEVRFESTTVAQKVFSVASLAHDEGDICVCVGDAGCGKTVAVSEYAKQNPGVVLVEVDYGYTPKILVSEIHKAIGGDGHGIMHDMLCDIVERLKGTERLIIIDEAENLPYRALELIRRIHDKAGIGILLVGLRRLFENIRGRRMQFAQLYSRVGGMMDLSVIEESDAEMLVQQLIPKANGISKVFYEVSKANCRTMSKLLRRSTAAAARQGVDVSPGLVRSVAKMLIV